MYIQDVGNVQQGTFVLKPLNTSNGTLVLLTITVEE